MVRVMFIEPAILHGDLIAIQGDEWLLCPACFEWKDAEYLKHFAHPRPFAIDYPEAKGQTCTRCKCQVD